MDAFDMALLLLLLQLLQVQVDQMQAHLFLILDEIEQEERRECHSRLQQWTHYNWFEWSSTLPDKIFWRMFQMPRDSFDVLCELIKKAVGKEKFKSESWLAKQVLLSMNAAMEAVGGFVSGQMKAALMLQILAGANYLDLLNQYNVSTASVYKFFHETVKWIIEMFQFPLKEWLLQENWEGLYHISDLFAAASGDTFKGCIGALDGLAIKMKCPIISNDLPDPGNYFCRKGFYALNVQAICDKLCQIIWVRTGNKGSTHDSTAFGGSRLNKYLEKIADKLKERGFFFVGDSAYRLLPN